MTAYGGSLLGGHSLRAECSPRDPPLTPWGNPVGNRDPDVDDQEVTFPRGGGWFLWSTHFDLLPLHNQMEGEPGGQPLHPQASIQPNEDIGHLINMLAMGL